jgi:hypothetical protein
MALEIVPLGREHMGALRRFAERVWKRPRSDAYYRWRYEEPEFHRAFLALREGECLAMECAIRRPWRMGERVQDVLEVFDWYCLPELVRSGLGVRVMQAFMREPGPLMLLGGTQDTQSLLPRLGWRVVATATRFTLPLDAGRAVSGLRSRVRLPRATEPLARAAAWTVLQLPGVRPRPRAVPRGGRAIALSGVGEEIHALGRGPTRYGSFPLWTDAHLRWLLAGFPAAGHFVPLAFAIDERLVGFALLRVHEAARGRAAELVEVFAPEPSADLYTWMISEAATRAAGFGPEFVSATTTCPLVEQALRRNRFLRTGTAPVQFRLGEGDALPEPLFVGSNTGDTPILHFPERWWGD